MCTCQGMCTYMQCPRDTGEGVGCPWKEFQVLVSLLTWVLATEAGFFRRRASALTSEPPLQPPPSLVYIALLGLCASASGLLYLAE